MGRFNARKGRTWREKKIPEQQLLSQRTLFSNLVRNIVTYLLTKRFHLRFRELLAISQLLYPAVHLSQKSLVFAKRYHFFVKTKEGLSSYIT